MTHGQKSSNYVLTLPRVTDYVTLSHVPCQADNSWSNKVVNKGRGKLESLFQRFFLKISYLILVWWQKNSLFGRLKWSLKSCPSGTIWKWTFRMFNSSFFSTRLNPLQLTARNTYPWKLKLTRRMLNDEKRRFKVPKLWYWPSDRY